MSINDGGPAFAHGGNEDVPSQEGMTLRDYFAAQALNGILAKEHVVRGHKSTAGNWPADQEQFVKLVVARAVAYADEMLRVL